MALSTGIYHAVHDHGQHHAEPPTHLPRPENREAEAEKTSPAEKPSSAEKTPSAEKTSSAEINSSAGGTSPAGETPPTGKTSPTEETSPDGKDPRLLPVIAVAQKLLRDDLIKRTMLVVILAVLSHVFLDTLGEDPHGVFYFHVEFLAQSHSANSSPFIAFVRPFSFLHRVYQRKTSASASYAAPPPMPTVISPPPNPTIIIPPGPPVHVPTWTFSIDTLLSLVTTYIYTLHPPFSCLRVTAVASLLMLIEGNLYLPRPISLETAMASSLSIALWSMIREVCSGWFVGKLIEGCEVVHLGEKEISDVKEMLDKGIDKVTSSEEKMSGVLSRGRERARSALRLMSERLNSLSRSAQQDTQNEREDEESAGTQNNEAALENGTDSIEESGEIKSLKRDSGFFEHHDSHSHPHPQGQDKKSNTTTHPQDSHVEGKPDEKREEPNRSSPTLAESIEKRGETLGKEGDGKGGKPVWGSRSLGREDKRQASRSGERGKEKEGGRRETGGTRKAYIH